MESTFPRLNHQNQEDPPLDLHFEDPPLDLSLDRDPPSALMYGWFKTSRGTLEEDPTLGNPQKRNT